MLSFVLLSKKKEKKKRKKNKSLMNIIKENRKALIWTIVFSFLMQILTLYIPIYMKQLIDNYNNIENYRKLVIVLFLIIAFYYSFSQNENYHVLSK